jgi:hypothetical protein
MRIIILLLIVAHAASAQTDVTKLDWLTGTWTRTNAKPGRSGAEVWTKKSATEITGRGISMKDADTTFVEKLKIVSKDGKLFYVADVPGNSTETWFEFTSVTDRGFVCENPKHDFPKKIVYKLDGSNLKATISGDGKAIDYLFVRKE